MRKIDDTEKAIAGFEAFLVLERGLSDNTRTAYLADVAKLIAYLTEEGVSLNDVTLSHLQAFAADLFDLGISPRSRSRIISGVKSFFRFLKMEGYLDSNPAILLENPKPGRHLPEVLSVDEIDAMISAIDPASPEAVRNHAIMETLYGCGLRVSELINLEISRVYLDEEYVVVRGKGSKERLVPLSPVAAAEIRRWLVERAAIDVKPGEENMLFISRRGRRLTRVMIFYIVKRLADLAGIRREVSPHTLRHSFATHLLEGSANLRAIQQMLGHESIATTEIYIHIDSSRLRSEILSCHPRNNPAALADL